MNLFLMKFHGDGRTTHRQYPWYPRICCKLELLYNSISSSTGSCPQHPYPLVMTINDLLGQLYKFRLILFMCMVE